jgi:hypothetical protein
VTKAHEQGQDSKNTREQPVGGEAKIAENTPADELEIDDYTSFRESFISSRSLPE